MPLSGTFRFRAARHASLALALIAATPVAALDASSVQHAAGVWRLVRDDGARACTIQLRGESAGSGYAVGLPPGCRHAMPDVARVAAWALPEPEHIDLTDRSGAAVLSFAAVGGELTAKSPTGGTYALVAANEKRKPRHAAQPEAAPSAPAGELSGRYSVLRDQNKDTGCMLTLQPGGRAQLAPACRDNGIGVFDPVGWSYAGGKLILRARKGHHAAFERNATDGSWQKDPKEGGKKLGFRKM